MSKLCKSKFCDVHFILNASAGDALTIAAGKMLFHIQQFSFHELEFDKKIL